MSHLQISHSTDLKQLRDEGYNIEIKAGYLLLKDVPYLNCNKQIMHGTIVSKLDLAGNKTVPPETHVAYFHGEYPCRSDGSPIEEFRNQSNTQRLANDVEINHMFSAKPLPDGKYKDYYHKMTTYVANISRHVQSINPSETAKVFKPIADEKDSSVFQYIDTASSRAEIELISQKLALEKVAIVGMGGSGSYVLDFIAKTPIKEIHVFDGDSFLQHNAFRAPGAPSLSDLGKQTNKAKYFSNIYSNMHRNIISHEIFVDETNVNQLEGMNFVFLCLDNGPGKKIIISKLTECNIPFVDVGMGIHIAENSLGGILRVTTCSEHRNNHIDTRINLEEDNAANEYATNIQIADLNALNATLAVIKWKKIYGFYMDFDQEHHCTYTIDGNMLQNEDKHE